MLDNDLEIYESCDLQQPNIPRRSRLYYLEPVGIATPHVESLTSFLMRLAQSHCVDVTVLITKEIATHIEKKYIQNNSNKGVTTLLNRGAALNSKGTLAEQLFQSLEHLTLRKNLSCLTLSFFKESFSTRNLHRKFKAWCPACYEQWRRSRQITYDEAELAKYIWIAKTIGELISFTPLASSLVQKAHIPKAFNQIINTTHEGNIAAFARTFGLPKNTVWMWSKGKSTPELKMLLTICYCLDISLLDFITLKKKAFESPQINPHRLPTAPRIQRTSPRAFDYETIENYLQTILDNPEIPPPTMKEVAERSGLDRRTIFSYFPALCKAISAKYRFYRKLETAKRIENCCKEIEQAVHQIYRSGEYPSEARVSELISQPGYFRYKEVRDTFKNSVANVIFKP